MYNKVILVLYDSNDDGHGGKYGGCRSGVWCKGIFFREASERKSTRPEAICATDHRNHNSLPSTTVTIVSYKKNKSILLKVCKSMSILIKSILHI